MCSAMESTSISPLPQGSKHLRRKGRKNEELEDGEERCEMLSSGHGQEHEHTSAVGVSQDQVS